MDGSWRGGRWNYGQRNNKYQKMKYLNVKGEIDTFQLKMFLNVWDISIHGSGQKTHLILNDGICALCHL